MQVLLVEDDELLARGIVTALTREHFAVNHVTHGRAALTCFATEPPDLMILDLGLPDVDGLVLLKQLRSQGNRTPTLILTARDALEQKVAGLDAGADDYLTKPFALAELLARLRALERRLSEAASSELRVGDVVLDVATHVVRIGEGEVSLHRREYMVLKALMEGAGRIQTRESLEGKIYSWDEEVGSNALEVHVHNLRKKLPAGFIETVRGVGYVVKKR